MADKGESNELESFNTSHTQAPSDGEHITFRGRKVSKKKLIIAAVVILFIILLIIIIILGALLGKEMARREGESRRTGWYKLVYSVRSKGMVRDK